MTAVTFRPGRAEDGYLAYRIFELCVGDLARRFGISQRPAEQDEAEIEKSWPDREKLYGHLCRTGERFLIAEMDGKAVGYARSILRDGMRELTEFFVLPGRQSAGIGRELLARVFPAEGARHRSVIATTDTRAMVRYLKSGVTPRFPIYNFSRVPRRLEPVSGLEAIPLTDSEPNMQALREIDRQVLGYTRDIDHRYWIGERSGFLYYHDGALEGYGYSGYDAGPFALLDDGQYPAVLQHAENEASGRFERIHMEVPLINKPAVDYLLGQGYEMGSFITLLLSDSPFGRCESYILPAPPFAL